MGRSGLSFGAVKFARFEKPEEKQRRAHERKCDAHERRRDRSEWQKIQQKARAESGHRGACRLASCEVVGALQQGVELGRRLARFVLLHGNQRIAVHRAAARIGV